MRAFLFQRVLHGILVVLGVATIVFILLHLTGDPAQLMSPPDATREDVARLRHQLGFDRPLPVQYGDFLAHALVMDFGQSLRYREPAMGLVSERMLATLELTAIALLFSLIIALPIGLVSALRRGSLIDLLGMVLALIGQSAPTFWLGLMLILIFSLNLRWFPPSGFGGPESLIMPGITLGAYSAAMITRLLRSGMLEVLASDYVRTAQAKGLTDSMIIMKHALRNAAMPVITVIGLQVGTLLGGAIVTEYVFSFPGIGRLVIQAISNRDFPVVQAFVVVLAAIVVFINALVDMLYFVIDPRVKMSEEHRG